MKPFRDVIRIEIVSTAAEIRSLKRWWRTASGPLERGTPPEERPERPATRFALFPSKERATLLCMTMAHSRGRIHRRDTSLDDQATAIRDALAAMDRMRVQTPLLDAHLRDAARAILALREPQTSACVAPTEERRA